MDDAAEDGSDNKQPATAETIDVEEDDAGSDEEDDILDNRGSECHVSALFPSQSSYFFHHPIFHRKGYLTMPAILKM